MYNSILKINSEHTKVQAITSLIKLQKDKSQVSRELINCTWLYIIADIIVVNI